MAEEEKKLDAKFTRTQTKFLRPKSSIKSIQEVPNAHDLQYDNPPQCIYTQPRRNYEYFLREQGIYQGISNRDVLRNIEKETQDAERQIFHETKEEIRRRGLHVDLKEMEKFMEQTKKQVYKRPMTAVHAYAHNNQTSNKFGKLMAPTTPSDNFQGKFVRTKVKKDPRGVYEKQESGDEAEGEEDEEEVVQIENDDAASDDEFKTKQKITKEEPNPINVDHTNFTRIRSSIEALDSPHKRPQSKITTARKRLLSSKTKFKVRVERNVDKKSTVNCKNNKKLKLSKVVCPDERTNKMKRLERKQEFERPLMDKELKPGSNKILFPSRKTEQEMLIFKEIFVEPKERELEEYKLKQSLEQKAIEDRITKLNANCYLGPSMAKFKGKKKGDSQPIPSKNVELNHSNMLNSSQHTLRKTFYENFKKAHYDDISEDDDDEGALDECVPDHYGDQDDSNMLTNLIDNCQDIMIKIVLQKFNSRSVKNRKLGSTQNNSSFFVQQIHVQPPDGLNATAAAPLTPGGGWAPSIPHVNPKLLKTSLKDLTIRAKAGVQAGDVQKESHMAYNLALLNEEKGYLKKAIRFYKRFFFCARLLEDPFGAALALNRIGVAYHKLRNFEKSFNFHKKHLEFSDNDNIYAGYYNSGIALRFKKKYKESIEYFKKSLDWARKREDYASECLSCGQLGIAYFLKQDSNQALAFYQTCLKISKQLKNFRLQLDCLLCIGYTIRTMLETEKQKDVDVISGDGTESKPTLKLEKSWELVLDAFDQAYNIARNLDENELAEELLCNVGIARANMSLNIKNDYFQGIVKNIPDFEDEDDEENAIDGFE